jgi:hypothetical protein
MNYRAKLTLSFKDGSSIVYTSNPAEKPMDLAEFTALAGQHMAITFGRFPELEVIKERGLELGEAESYN